VTLSTLTTNSAAPLDSSTITSSDSVDEPLFLGLALSVWIRIASLSALFICLFWPNLRRLWDKTNPINGADPNWQHAIFVPLVGLYYLYVNREKLLAARVRTTWEGLAIAVGGILFFVYGIWPGQNDWFKDAAMVITLFGVVTFLCGWPVMKTAWFPIVFLFCALPWPGLFYSLLAGPLQKLAAYVAVRVLNNVGVSAGQYGNKLFIMGKEGVQTLNVAEACSGLRSLMTFVSIAAAVAFLSVRPLWQKLVMVASAIPIAITCNTLRVAVQGILNHYRGTQWSESFAHGFVGLLMMIPAFFLILLVGWVLQNLFVEEVDDKAQLRSKANLATAARAAAISPGVVVRKQPAPPAPEQRKVAAIAGAASVAPPVQPATAAPRPAASVPRVGPTTPRSTAPPSIPGAGVKPRTAAAAPPAIPPNAAALANKAGGVAGKPAVVNKPPAPKAPAASPSPQTNTVAAPRPPTSAAPAAPGAKPPMGVKAAGGAKPPAVAGPASARPPVTKPPAPGAGQRPPANGEENKT
jgi:exosortase